MPSNAIADALVITPGRLTLADLERVYRSAPPVRLAAGVMSRVARAAATAAPDAPSPPPLASGRAGRARPGLILLRTMCRQRARRPLLHAAAG